MLGTALPIAAQTKAPSEAKNPPSRSLATKPAPTKPAAVKVPAGNTAEVVSSASFRYTIDAKLPAWVSPVALDMTAVPSQKAPWHYVLIDDQFRATPKSQDRHVHVVRRIVDSAGLSDATQIMFRFDPSFQTLTIHDIALIRGTQRLGKLAREKVRLLQREENLDRLIYDGVVTASIVIDDARAGDLIEYSYTVSGANPVFEDRFLQLQTIRAPSAPSARVHLRLVHPKGRKIAIQAQDEGIEMRETESATEREVLLVLRDVGTANWLSDLPPGTFMKDMVAFSEYPDWASVATWATRTFSRAMQPSAQVAARAATIRDAGGGPREWALRALDFVQRDIRYLGVELGEYSHLPSAADKVISQRYGDCKDKSVLLVAILQELGVTAYPVLVSSRLLRFVIGHQPSPFAFDHAIVGIELDGRTYWVDPTRNLESGSLEDRAAEFGAGLPVREGMRELVVAPHTGPAPLAAAYEDEIRVKAFDVPARLAARITYYGSPAQRLIANWNSSGRTELEKGYAGEYARRYSGARQVGDFRLVQDPASNSARLEGEFELPQLFEYPEQNALVANVSLWGVIPDLRGGFDSSRTQPFYLGNHRKVTHKVTLTLPEAVRREAQEFAARVDDPHFSLSQRVALGLSDASFQVELETRADVVDSGRWQEFHKKAVEAGNRTYSSFRFPAIALAKIPELQTSLRQLDQEFSRGGSPWTTVVQLRAEGDRILLSEHLRSGRLTKHQQASALLARSIAVSHMGRIDDAISDAKQALSLSDSVSGGQFHLGVVLWTRGQFEESRQSATLELAKTPNDARSLALIGRTHFHGGDYASAKQHFLRAARADTGDGRTYAVAWAILAARQLGEDAGAIGKEFPVRESDDRFAHQVVRFLLGAISERELLAKVRNTSRSVQISQECEAYFYVGMAYLLAKDSSRARVNFERSVATKVYEFVEYTSAKHELARLK